MWHGHLGIFLCQGVQDRGPEHLNPLNPKSGQHQFSPNDITTPSKEKIMGINIMITKEGKCFHLLSNNPK